MRSRRGIGVLLAILLAAPLATGLTTAPLAAADTRSRVGGEIAGAIAPLGARPVLLVPDVAQPRLELTTAVLHALEAAGAVVIPRERLARVLAARNLREEELANLRIALLIAEIAGADGLLHSETLPEGGRPEVVLRLHRVPGGELLHEVRAHLERAPPSAADPDPCPPRDTLARQSDPRIVPPRCAACPRPRWSRRTAGQIVVEYIVTRHGRTCDIRLLRGAEPKLDREAIAIVEIWRHEPATRDGEPIAVVVWNWL